MIKRLYRQRRRIAAGLCLVALALVFAALANPLFYLITLTKFGGSVLAAGLVFGLCFLSVALIVFCAVIVLVPKGRRSIEVISASFAITEGLEALARLNGIAPLPDTVEYLPFLAIYTLLATVLEHDLPGRFGLRMNYRATSSIDLPVTAEAIWAAVAPDEGTRGTYWTRSLARVSARADLGPGWVEAHYRLGGQGFFIQRQKRLVWEPYRHLRYAFEPEGLADQADPGAVVGGTLDARIEPLSDGRTRLTLTHDYRGVPFGRWATIVLDDVVPGEVDAISARLTGRRDWSLQGRVADTMAASL